MLILPDTIARLSLYNGKMVYIEDALGWTVPVLLDSYTSWEVIKRLKFFVRSKVKLIV
jgi:hypothetical protein